MISEIKIQNFKCYSNLTTIEMAELTACVGMNSMGKSTLIQALLLIRQTYETMRRYAETKKRKVTVFLNDRYALQLGDSNQILSSKESDILSIYIDDLKFFYRQTDDMLSLSVNQPASIEYMEKQGGVFSPQFYYLNAERVGPRTFHAMEATENMHCGFFGEQTYQVLAQNAYEKVDEGRCYRGQSAQSVRRLDKQVEYWLDYIVPGIEISSQNDMALRLSHIQLSQPALDTSPHSPHSFGFGISYMLPIIVTGLLAKKNAMFIVENPEAHLHPAGQSRIGRFLSCIANDGVRVVLETHSEHVINGIRLYALENKIAPEKLSINYFAMDSAEKKHTVKRIHLNERMDILDWPDGFYDQEEKDLRDLRMLRSLDGQ